MKKFKQVHRIEVMGVGVSIVSVVRGRGEGGSHVVREDVAHNINWQADVWLSVERISCLELSFCLHVGSDFPV